MIKAEDLRIGDLVIVNENCSLEQGTIGKVSEVLSPPLYKENEGSIGLKPISNDRWSWGVLCRNIDPIPLTPEILEKNGLKEEVVGEYYTKPLDDETHPLERYLAVELKRGNWAVFIKYCRFHDCALLRKIQHVHELQHILWALGLDANLKI